MNLSFFAHSAKSVILDFKHGNSIMLSCILHVLFSPAMHTEEKAIKATLMYDVSGTIAECETVTVRIGPLC